MSKTLTDIEITAYAMYNAKRVDRGLPPVEVGSIANFNQSHWVRCVKNAIEAAEAERLKHPSLIIAEKERRQCRSPM